MRIAIFGCGWLGRVLAKKLQVKHSVFGAVRSEASMQKLGEENITAFQNPGRESAFWEVEVFVIAISPRREYLETLKRVSRFLRPSLKQIILLSSTSVYADLEGVVDEKSPLKHESMVYQGESLFKKLFPDGVIVRLGGLMGEDRIAGQWPSKAVQDTAVNYIHQDDAVGIIEAVIEQNIQNEIINAVAPKHPRRSDIYKINAEVFGFELPMFEKGKERIVSSEKSRTLLGYGYVFDDPMAFWSDSRDRPRLAQRLTASADTRF